MNVAIFASNNGLGHVRRCVILSNYLLKKKIKITLFANKKKVKKFYRNNKLTVKNFLLNHNYLYKKRTYRISGLDNIKKKNLKNFDIVISDNYPEISKFHSNVIIFANFFWHEILKINKYKKKELSDLIVKNNYPVFGNYIFQNISSAYKRFNVNFFSFRKKTYLKKKNIKNILIAIGTAHLPDGFIKKLKDECEKISLELKKNFKFYVDDQLYKKLKKNNNFKLAKFDDRMYSKINIAIIKPGLGTIEECLNFNIPIIAFDK